MSAEQNIDTARQMYQAFRPRGRPGCPGPRHRRHRLVDRRGDRIRAVVRPQARQGRAGQLLPGHRHDRAGHRVHAAAFASNDDGDVMVFIRYAFTVAGNGKHVAMNMHHY